jgi:hypothetical protein
VAHQTEDMLRVVALIVRLVLGLDFEMIQLFHCALDLLQFLMRICELVHNCGLRSLEFVERLREHGLFLLQVQFLGMI